MSSHYFVAVVGAGPAGLFGARELANLGAQISINGGAAGKRCGSGIVRSIPDVQHTLTVERGVAPRSHQSGHTHYHHG